MPWYIMQTLHAPMPMWVVALGPAGFAWSSLRAAAVARHARHHMLYGDSWYNHAAMIRDFYGW